MYSKFTKKLQLLCMTSYIFCILTVLYKKLAKLGPDTFVDSPVNYRSQTTPLIEQSMYCVLFNMTVTNIT